LPTDKVGSGATFLARLEGTGWSSSIRSRGLGATDAIRSDFAFAKLSGRDRQQVIVTYDEIREGIDWIVRGATASDPSLGVGHVVDDPSRVAGQGRGRRGTSGRSTTKADLPRARFSTLPSGRPPPGAGPTIPR